MAIDENWRGIPKVLPQLARMTETIALATFFLPEGEIVVVAPIPGEPGMFGAMLARDPRRGALRLEEGSFEVIGTWVLDTPYDRWQPRTPDPAKMQVEVVGVVEIVGS